MRQAGRPFEVVFMSCDRDPKSFNDYLSHMPVLNLKPLRPGTLAQVPAGGIPCRVGGGRGCRSRRLLAPLLDCKDDRPGAMDALMCRGALDL